MILPAQTAKSAPIPCGIIVLTLGNEIYLTPHRRSASTKRASSNRSVARNQFLPAANLAGASGFDDAVAPDCGGCAGELPSVNGSL